MARVRAFGTEFAADLIENLGNGTWRARARTDTGRTAPGTVITVKQSEILEAAAAEMPIGGAPPPELTTTPSTSISLNDLETAMAKERETLPSPADLIAQHRENLQQAVSVPAGPTQRPPRRPTQEEK